MGTSRFRDDGKDEGMPELVCYCFEYTAEDILRDYEAHGHSTLLEKIKAEKKSGNCRCAAKNPKGR